MPGFSPVERSDAQISQEDLEARVKRLVAQRFKEETKSTSPLEPAGLQEATGRIIEEVLVKLGSQHSGRLTGTDTLSELKALVDRLDMDMRVLSGELPPVYVRNPDGLLHRALERGTCPCSWAWKKYGGTPVTASEWERACEKIEGVCSRCRDFAS